MAQASKKAKSIKTLIKELRADVGGVDIRGLGKIK